MNETKNQLAEISSEQDRVKGYLVKLEKLRIEGQINDESYVTTKAEYEQRIDAAAEEIARLKVLLKKQLESMEPELKTVRWDLEQLEIKYKIGDAPAEKYQSLSNGLRLRVQNLETEKAELEKLINADSVIQITTVTPASEKQQIIETKPTAVIPDLSKRVDSSLSNIQNKVSGLKIPKLESTQHQTISLKNLRLTLAFDGELLSIMRMVTFTAGILMLVGILFLPWVDVTGFGLSLFLINGAMAAGCVIFTLIYVAATFIADRRLRSLAHIGVAIICLILWLVLRFTTITQITKFAIVVDDMLGIGLLVFLLADIIGIMGGILEMFPKIDRKF
jgi:uncharacterized small protein (DUF1192 family)